MLQITELKNISLNWPNFRTQLSLKLPRFGIFSLKKIRAGEVGDNIDKLNLNGWDLSKISRAMLINQDRGFDQLSMVVLLLIKIWSFLKCMCVSIYQTNYAWRLIVNYSYIGAGILLT